MGGRKPMTQTINVSQARQEFSQLLNKVFRKEARVIVEKSGIPVVAIISAQDFQRLNRLEVEWDEPFKALDETRAAFQDVPDEELEREVARTLATVRAERRKELGARSRKQ
ncbi:MAG: Antitoxin [Chloroflexi bacterium]|nr:Antitoxin [Chloroflexota bacterium]